MAKVVPMSDVARFLDDMRVRRPDVVVLLHRDREAGTWSTGAVKDVAGAFPLADMIGMLEVLKAQLLGRYFEEVTLEPHEFKDGEDA